MGRTQATGRLRSERESSGQIKPWGSLNWPNRISILRLVMVAPFLVLLMNHNIPAWSGARYAALAIFLVMAVSDLVDGMLARRMNDRTRLGAILDPLADKTMVICAVVLLSLEPSAVTGARLSNWVVVAIVGKDLWVIVGFLVVYLVTDRFRVWPTRTGKACTFGQVVMVGLVLIAPDLDGCLPRLGSSMAIVASWIVAFLCGLAAVSYTRLGLRFVAEGAKPIDENHVSERTDDEHD